MGKDPISLWNHLHRNIFSAMSGHGAHGEPGWCPNADVFEGPDGLVVKLELSGVPPDSVQVYVEGTHLVVEGIRRDPYSSATAAGYKFQQMEIEYGPFRRVVDLPCPVNARQARAQGQDGFLSVRLPRARSVGKTLVTLIIEE